MFRREGLTSTPIFSLKDKANILTSACPDLIITMLFTENWMRLCWH